MTIHTLWQSYPEIAQELENVQRHIQKSTKIRNKTIDAALELFFHEGGKLLRPAFFLCFTQFGEVPSQKKKYRLAASLEILHAATLIHDDIIDDSPLRRNLPSIQAHYGKNVAVYTGDFLFTVYFQLLASSAKSQQSLETYALYMRKILVGELDQMNVQYNIDITIKEYLRYLKGKTAQLFQLSCYMGADFANAPLRVQVLSQRIGHQIGMAFQIQDDILDYVSSEETLRKPVLEDIANGIYTLPLIFAIQQYPEQIVPLLAKKEALTEEDTYVIQEIITSTTCLAQAQSIAKRYTDQALNNIQKLPDIPVRQELFNLTKNLLHRVD